MNLLHLNKIKPGMVLAEDLFNRDGRRLLVKGQVLSEKELRVLKIWGVTEARIEDGNTPDEGLLPLDPALAGKLRSRLEDRFRQNDIRLPVVKTVFSLCLLRMAGCYIKDPSAFKSSRDPADLPSPSDSIRNDAIQPVENIQRLFKENLQLPALPTVFSQINDAIKNPNCSGKDIADIVSKDTSLSAKLLKIINSAYYGLNRKVDSLTYAALALGTRQISSLAMGITVINYFKGISNQIISMQSFWKHSVACAVCARTLAAHIKGANPEPLFLGGLLHDIGRLLLLNYFPEESVSVIETSRAQNSSIFTIEPSLFTLTHAELGSLVARSWNFPDNILKMIHGHHDTFLKSPEMETAIIHVSDWLVHALEIGSSGEQIIPELQVPAWQLLGISESILETIIQQIDRQVSEAISFFYE